MGSLARFLAHALVAWCGVTTVAHAEVPAPAPAEPPAPTSEANRAQCLASHEQAQDARLAGQLLSARRALRECSAAACPSLVSRDCVLWLDEVEAQIPTVRFRATKDNEDVVALRVREGTQLLTDSLTGSPLELDPGPHHFVAELPGFPAQEATYVLQAGDKGREVRFDFISKKPVTTKPTPLPGPPEPRLHRPIPLATYALAGVTVAASLTGSILGGLALHQRNDVERRCAPLCEDRDLVGVRRLALGADIAFLSAVLAGGATAYSYVVRPSEPVTQRPAAALPRVRLVWAGWAVLAHGNF